MLNLAIILLSVVLQIAAAGFGVRISRTAGRPVAWFMVALALVLMAARRLFVLVELLEKDFPERLLPNEVMGLLISALMLTGVLLIQGIFRAVSVGIAPAEASRLLTQELGQVGVLQARLR